MTRWWGCSAANQYADRAGSYRRIAVGLAALPVPLVVVATALLLDRRSPVGYALAYLAVAGGSGWLAAELLHDGSSLNGRGRPHASSVALLTGMVFLIGSAPVEPAVGFGPPMLLLAGMAGLVIGFMFLMAAERHRDRLLGFIGRWVIVGGAVLVGSVMLVRMVRASEGALLHAGGLGAVAVLLLGMAWCEARLLLRGMALLRALAQR